MPNQQLPPLRPSGMMDPRYQPIAFHLAPGHPVDPEPRLSCAFHQRDQLELLSKILDKLSAILEEVRETRSELTHQRRATKLDSQDQASELLASMRAKVRFFFAILEDQIAYNLKNAAQWSGKSSTAPSPPTPKAMDEWDMMTPSTEGLS